MPRSLRLVCPGATSAGVATTLLVQCRATFTVKPSADSGWVIDAELPDGTNIDFASEVPVVIESTGQSPAGDGAETVTDRIEFRAADPRAAKRMATRLTASEFGAQPYATSTWGADGQMDGIQVFTRAGYRGKRTGEIVVGTGAEGACWVGWRPPRTA